MESSITPFFTCLIIILSVLLAWLEESRRTLYLSERGWRALPAGITPLMLAVATNKKRYVEILLQYGADTAVHDADGKTVWDYAAFADAELQELLKTAASHQ